MIKPDAAFRFQKSRDLQPSALGPSLKDTWQLGNELIAVPEGKPTLLNIPKQ